jgi:hypothetical protein
MNHRATCTMQAGSCFVSGTVLFAYPPLVLGLLGLDGPGLVVLVRLLGGILFALGATLLGAREVTDRTAQRAVSIGNLSCDLSLGVMLAGATWAGTLSAFGWFLAVVFWVNAASWAVALRKVG